VLSHLTPKERLAYAVIACGLLFFFGYVGAQHLQSAAPIAIKPSIETASHEPHVPRTGSQERTVSNEANSSHALSSTILVDIVGAVRHPGLVRLTQGARIADAIDAAGGVTPDADVDQVNLAAYAVDASRIVIPVQPTDDEGNSEAERVVGTGGNPPSPPVGRGKTPPALGSVDLNSADADALANIPGIGPTTAQRIVEFRNEQGPLTSVDDLRGIRGFGKNRIEQIRPYFR